MSTPPAPQQPAPAAKRRGERRSSSELLRSGGLIALAVLVTLFAVLNLDEVKVDWVFGSGHVPLIIVIVISVLVGIVLTYMTERIQRKRR